MVERIFTFIEREVRGIHEAAYLLGLFAILSQVLGLIRDRLFAHTFGASAALDVYYAAFRIPDFLFVAIASFVSVYVLVPFLAERLERGRAEARLFVNRMASFFLVSIGAASVVAFIAAPALARVVFPGFDETMTANAVLLARVLLLQPILLGLSSLFGSIIQIHQKFLLYALSPLFYNAGIIFGIVFLYPVFGLIGLAYGVVLGAALHFVILLPSLVRHGFSPALALPDFGELSRVLTLSLPRTLSLSMHQIALVSITAFASFVAPGAIAVFNLSFNLQAVPLAIIGTSYSVAAFPTLARLFSLGNREEFLVQVRTAARHIMFWSFPAIVLTIVLRAQIVRVILGSGAFSWSDTRLTAAALALFSVSLLAQSLVLLLVRGYYAAGMTRTPLVVNTLAALTAIALSFVLWKFFTVSEPWRFFIEALLRVEDIHGTAVLMFPLGYSLAMVGNAIAILFVFERDFRTFSASLVTTALQSFSASVIMGFVAYQFLGVFDDIFDINTFTGIFAQGLLSGILGVSAAVVILRILRSAELAEAVAAFRRKFWKAQVLAPEIDEQA